MFRRHYIPCKFHYNCSTIVEVKLMGFRFTPSRPLHSTQWKKLKKSSLNETNEVKRCSSETFYNLYVFSKWFEPRSINCSYGVIVLVRVMVSCSESSEKRLSVDGVVSLVRWNCLVGLAMMVLAKRLVLTVVDWFWFCLSSVRRLFYVVNKS